VQHEHDGGGPGGRRADRLEAGEGVRHSTSFLSGRCSAAGPDVVGG
jgi:hypothetical protein